TVVEMLRACLPDVFAGDLTGLLSLTDRLERDGGDDKAAYVRAICDTREPNEEECERVVEAAYAAEGEYVPAACLPPRETGDNTFEVAFRQDPDTAESGDRQLAVKWRLRAKPELGTLATMPEDVTEENLPAFVGWKAHHALTAFRLCQYAAVLDVLQL